ncbi:MAG: chemotaxis protein CheC [Haloferacaceae archaeon]
MRIDLDRLGTFNELAHQGAERAAESLGTLTGVAPDVAATTVDLARQHDIVQELSVGEYVGVTIGFDGALAGEALIVFDAEGARRLVRSLPGPTPQGREAVRSRISEVGNILVSGFTDGWADHLGAAIEITPPTFVAGSGRRLIPADTDLEDDDQVFAFSSFLETMDATAEAAVYLFPEREGFRRVLADQLPDADAPVPLDRLRTFNRMAARGAERAGENVTTMTGTETTVDVSRLRFLPTERLPERTSDRPRVGVTAELRGMPSGHLLVLFDEESAATVAERLGAGAVEDEFTAMHRSAVEEVGNIMISGFIDGWANVLDTTIQHTPPEFVHDSGSDVVRPVAADLAARQDYAFVFDSRVETTDDAVTCTIYTLPDEAELRRALDSLSVGDSPEALAAEMDADPDDLF